jgi:hypothetical protein
MMTIAAAHAGVTSRPPNALISSAFSMSFTLAAQRRERAVCGVLSVTVIAFRWFVRILAEVLH